MSQLSHLHTAPSAGPLRTSQAIVGSDTGIPGSIRPVRYRYILADLRSGKVIAMLPMTSVSYAVSIYSGTEMSGTIYLPDMFLDEMPGSPLGTFERWRHPDQGLPRATYFEVGNKALYVMRNDKVVWGGILWGRSYSSGDSTMAITALSWEGYIYYRAFRKSVIFPKTMDKYTIWRAVLMQCMTDFTWKGEDGAGKNAGLVADVGSVAWTGKVRSGKSNQALTLYREYWPNNSPPIELPPAGLKFKHPMSVDETKAFTTVEDRWRGYEMGNIGEQLQTWADANTLVTSGGFEYRVLCWYDYQQERFRQRYTFGEMEYNNDPTDDDPSGQPTSILNPLLGSSYDQRTDVIFDFPGHISEWSLTEGMEDVATRMITMGNTGEEAYSKIAEYRSQIDLLQPGYVGNGSDGWLLYDKVLGYESNSPGELGTRAEVMLSKMRPSIAARPDDIAAVNNTTQRTSARATDLSITLYQDPTTTFPDWSIGDWVTFAIEDPFYGGKMYLQRRIIGYSVTVVPDQESDYSHEQISLDLTDQSKVAESAG
jgi:hypothetical protein